MTQRLSKEERRRRAALPAYEVPGAVAPPLSWTRRFTPLGIGRRGVRLQMAGGLLSVVRVRPLGGERVVVDAPVEQFHSPAPSRGGRGLHLWHGDRVVRLVGRSSAEGDGDTSTWTLGDDPVSAVIGVILLPVYLVALLGLYTERVASQRARLRRCAGPSRWSARPRPGHRPPATAGCWLGAGRCTLRLAVVGALVPGSSRSSDRRRWLVLCPPPWAEHEPSGYSPWASRW
ncbi:hypothetical protein ACI782_23345 [Geodermatophilus sp. SYSU D00703]